jgi:REP element-mobilizing transposase RayT
MARIARVVLPDYPHHVTQRGNRWQLVFFSDEDYRTYRTMLTKACHMALTEDWPWSSASAHLAGAETARDIRVGDMSILSPYIKEFIHV